MRLTLVHYPNLLGLLGRGWTESELCRIHNIHSRRWEVELPVDANPSAYTVRQLKERLEDIHGLDADDQVLRFKGRTLEDAEVLASCGVVSGAALMLGGCEVDKKKPQGEEEAPGSAATRTAEKQQGSLTETMAEAASEVPSGQDEGTATPWWTGSRLSGPQGGSRPTATPAPTAETALAGVVSPLDAGAASADSTLSPEELRRRRLARFG
mmetsp:Transcript_21405/g.47445  ORF Transcript_21405/g.47445 Transcript_21405/m.47445 type:complete len:211 (+) Transcript_21405:58-690(+)